MSDEARTSVRSVCVCVWKNGVLHRGSILSLYLFLLVVDELTKEVQDEAPWCVIFTDVVVYVEN